MRILLVQTNYPAFLKSFYSKHPTWGNLTYKQIKILWSKGFFGISNFFSKHLRKLGWEAEDVILDDWNSQSRWAQEHGLNIKKVRGSFLRQVPFPIKTRLGLIDNWIAKILLAQVKFYKPDIVFFHHLGLLKPQELKRVKKGTKLLVGQIASPLPSKDKLQEFNLLISSFPHFVDKFRGWGINSEYLRWCAEKTVLEKIGEHKRRYGVVYVGAFTPHHSRGNRTLEELARQIKVDYWGYGENYLLPTSPIKKYLHGQAWGREMYEIFAKSKIVVNRHINIARDYANNLRMYEATLMGALLITEHKKNLDKIFKVGKEVISYKNSTDLIKKVKYYLKHDKEREKIAEAGQKRTLKAHTYDVRMKELDKILRRYLEK